MQSYQLTYQEELMGEVSDTEMNTLRKWAPILGHKTAWDSVNRRLHIDAALTGKVIHLLLPPGLLSNSDLVAGYNWSIILIRHFQELLNLAGATAKIVAEHTNRVKPDLTVQFQLSADPNMILSIKLPLFTCLFCSGRVKAVKSQITSAVIKPHYSCLKLFPLFILELGESNTDEKMIAQLAEEIARGIAVFFAPSSQPDLLFTTRMTEEKQEQEIFTTPIPPPPKTPAPAQAPPRTETSSPLQTLTPAAADAPAKTPSIVAFNWPSDLGRKAPDKIPKELLPPEYALQAETDSRYKPFR